jgi:transitional endoplasmic reticulum ATPase
VGSTNHLDRLDPGISKRPSRFDRKYYFPDPNFDERVAYCDFWKGKLADNDDIKFPQKLSPAIAGITDGFSFAYIQEAFVAALLAIASRSGEAVYDNSWRQPGGGKPVLTEVVVADEDPDLKDLVLWKEMKKQVKILRDEMESESHKAAK